MLYILHIYIYIFIFKSINNVLDAKNGKNGIKNTFIHFVNTHLYLPCFCQMYLIYCHTFQPFYIPHR